MSVSSVNVSRRYHIRDEIGRGSLGVVYRAIDRLTGQMVALKRLPLEPMRALPGGHGDDLRLALAREFRVLASLRHPHIISVLDYGFDDRQTPYYAMDLLEGARTIVAYGRSLSLERKVSLLVELLQALAYLHRRGIIHRDLKPANVLVIDHHVKVVDFELAVVREQIADSQTVAGTLEYMAPEVLQGEAPSEAADLYAVGVMAFELLAGSHPFDTSSINRLLADVLYAAPDWNRLPEAHRLGSILARLLAKSPGERFGDATEVIQALAHALKRTTPLETIAIRESYLQAAVFVGRAAEYEQLAGALYHVLRDGAGSAWLVGGESGVGKSRLLDEFRIEAVAGGALVLRGQDMAGARQPYQLWRDPIRQLLLETDLDTPTLSTLSQLVPDLERLTDRLVSAPEPLDSAENQRRLVAAILRAFRALTRPAVIILEDLQWAEDGYEALAALVTLTKRLPLLIIGSFRDDEAPDLYGRFPEMKPIWLGRLPHEAIAELSAAMLGEAGRQAEVVALLQRETEGNVFFLVEIVRALAEEAGGLGHVGLTALPARVVAGGVTEVIQRRLNRVPVWGQPLLKLAAVHGRGLDLALMEQLVRGNMAPALPDGTDLATWLTVCSSASVLEAQDGRWRFSHDKLREALLHGLNETERRAAHRAVALALECAYPDDPSRALALVEHWRQAKDDEREAHYAPTAVEQLLAVSNLREAVSLAQRALTLVSDAAGKARLLARLGEAEHSLGNLDEARRSLEESLGLAQTAGDERTVIRTLSDLGSIHARQGNYDLAQTHFRDSLALAQSKGHQRAIASNLEHLGDVAARQGSYDQARDYYSRGLAINRDIDNKLGIAGCLSGLAWVASGQSEHATAITYYTQSLALARELGDRRSIAVDLGNLGAVATAQGDYIAAIRYYRESLSINRDIGHKAGTAWALWAIARVAFLQGEYAQAASLAGESLALNRALGDRVFIAVNLRLLGQIAAATGEYAEARALFEQSLALARESGQRLGIAANLLFLGRLESARGRANEARQYFEQSLALAGEMGYKDYIADNLTELGHLAAIRGDTDAARDCFERSLALARESGYKEGQHATWLQVGRHATAENQPRQALDAYQQSLSLAQSSGMRPSIAVSLVHLARVYRLLEQYDRARDCLLQSLQLARDGCVIPILLDALASVAHLRLEAGEVAGCAALVGLIREHPAATAETRDEALGLLDALAARLPAAVLEDVLQSGARMELDRVIDGILAEGPRPEVDV